MIRGLIGRIAVASALGLALLVGATASEGQTTQTQNKAAAKAKAKAKAGQKKQAAAAKLDLNKASADEMVENLPGVGEVTAKKIVAGRPYAKVDDLARAGVPQRTIDGIRDMVIVSQPAPAKPVSTKKVNLNTASLEELQTLPGIGPVHARDIVALRPIKALSDLEKIKGLSKEKVEELDDHVVILTAPPAAPATAPAAKAKAKSKAGAAAKTANTASAAPHELQPGQKININKASQDELQLLPGIGPVKSKAIVEARPFKKPEDVMSVKGIKEASFARIKDHIVVD